MAMHPGDLLTSRVLDPGKWPYLTKVNRAIQPRDVTNATSQTIKMERSLPVKIDYWHGGSEL